MGKNTKVQEYKGDGTAEDNQKVVVVEKETEVK